MAIRQENPAKIIAAVPVGAIDSIEQLKDYADEIVVLRAPESLGAIGQFYLNFAQVEDREVERILKGYL